MNDRGKKSLHKIKYVMIHRMPYAPSHKDSKTVLSNFVSFKLAEAMISDI